jgi:hypothetical protein
MKPFDSLMEKDGKVSSLATHLAVWMGCAVVLGFVLKLLGALLVPAFILAGAWAGYQSWQSDKFLNGTDHDS